MEGLERRGSRGWEEGRDVSFPEVGPGGKRQFHRIAGVEEPGVSQPRGWGSGVGGWGKRGATKEVQRHRAHKSLLSRQRKREHQSDGEKEGQ